MTQEARVDFVHLFDYLLAAPAVLPSWIRSGPERS